MSRAKKIIDSQSGWEWQYFSVVLVVEVLETTNVMCCVWNRCLREPQATQCLSVSVAKILVILSEWPKGVKRENPGYLGWNRGICYDVLCLRDFESESSYFFEKKLVSIHVLSWTSLDSSVVALLQNDNNILDSQSSWEWQWIGLGIIGKPVRLPRQSLRSFLAITLDGE